MRAAIDRTVPARLLADPHAIGYFRSNRATNCAMRADVLVDGNRRARCGRRSGLCLAHAGERQRAQSRETTSGKTRAEQKTATIETLAGVAGKDGQAALLFAFGPLDQHGRLL